MLGDMIDDNQGTGKARIPSVIVRDNGVMIIQVLLAFLLYIREIQLLVMNLAACKVI